MKRKSEISPNHFLRLASHRLRGRDVDSGSNGNAEPDREPNSSADRNSDAHRDGNAKTYVANSGLRTDPEGRGSVLVA